MAKKQSYFFNPKTLKIEKGKLSVKEIVIRVSWFVATAVAFSVLVLWLSFYFFSSPKEKIKEQENNALRFELQILNDRMEKMSLVLADLQERDDYIYRAILETDPIPYTVRNPMLLNSQYNQLSEHNLDDLIKMIKEKADQLTVQLATQSLSFDTVSALAKDKEKMMESIPAIRPLKGLKQITSGFGMRYHPILKYLRFHSGVDITTPKGTPVYATGAGTVSSDDGGSGYGICIVIEHGYSYQTLYAHLSKMVVRPGQKVKRGQLIGYTGNTGLSKGPHLHYEVRKNGAFVNPVYYFFIDITSQEYDLILKTSQEVNQSLS
ncbi:MAG: M23 family metallopeptidase [Bacteroidales bacterium]|jgi:murein DD-endopeptidase MepM/ murein hydrolase activator NlpD|nr:M23 family metallopeptidase [Bacteroidales bacterium]